MLKIIAEDTYHRPAIADGVVCENIASPTVAEVIRKALQDSFGEDECRTFRVVGMTHVPYDPN